MGRRKSKTAGQRLEERFAGWGEETRRAERHFVVVSYDIPDDRRRNRVCKLLKDYGERVQYSVFECMLRPDDLKRLRERLKPLLVLEEDDVRFLSSVPDLPPQGDRLGAQEETTVG